MRRWVFVLKASRRFFCALVSVHEAELQVMIEIMTELWRASLWQVTSEMKSILMITSIW